MTGRDAKGGILVFVPMYNCAAQIPRVLDQLRAPEVAAMVDGVVCVDNRSTDDTLEAARAGLADHPLQHRWLLRNEDNYGLGGSHKVAIDLARNNGYDFLIVLHGDDQGAIADILPYLHDRAHHETDFLLGARFMKGSRLIGYSKMRTILNKVLNLVFSAIIRRRVYDIGSGLNLFRVSAFNSGFERKFADDLTFNLYLVFGIAASGLRMKFFPLSWREDDQVSNARLARIAMRVLVLLRRRLLSSRQYLTQEHRETPREGYPSEVIEAWSAPP